jgi:hypothetical protein
MASGGKEHRMVFDIRGRRRHVVKAVYAILALLMGVSLFLVVGPVNLGSLLGNSTSTGNAAGHFEEQAKRLERKLAKEPENDDLVTGLIRARVNAATQLVETNSAGETALSAASVQQLQQASNTWSQYLKKVDEPSVTAATSIAPVLLQLAQTSNSNGEIESNMKAAAQAQQIVVDQRRNLNTLSTLALYKLYSFEYPGAQKVGKEAGKLAGNKFERENLENQLEETEKAAKAFQTAIAKETKLNKKASEEVAAENPLNSLGSSNSLSP